MPGVQVAGAVGGADRKGHGGLQATDSTYGGPVMHDRCGVRMHHPRIDSHTGNEHAGPPCGPACGRGLRWEASTRVDDPWINERMPRLDSIPPTHVDEPCLQQEQVIPLVSFMLSELHSWPYEMQSYWNYRPYFSVFNWAQVWTGQPMLQAFQLMNGVLHWVGALSV